MFIDTHAHLNYKVLKDNINNVLKSCHANNVEKIISVGCTLKEAKETLLLAENHSEIFASVGLYPHDTEEESTLNDKQKLYELENLLDHKKVVAIGECGLDFKTPQRPEVKREIRAQAELFEAQLALAKRLNFPLIIHSREATSQTLEILSKYKDVNKVWHCFANDYETALKAINLNCLLSFTGIITYPKNSDLREVVKKIPLESIMLETDSPYLIPQKARGMGIKTNDPSYVKMVAQELSSIKNIDLDLVEEKTSQNAIKFFRLPQNS